jgi:hypothetical protein
MAGERWTAEEQECFESLCGDMPWPMVVASMHHEASRYGWPRREESALKRKAECDGIQVSSVGEWVRPKLIADTLKISSNTVVRWIKANRLPARRFYNVPYVSRKSLREFANREPHVFAGLPVPDLVQLLSDQRLAEKLTDYPVRMRRFCSPVVCVTTGRRFESIAAAAKDAGVTKQRLRDAIRERQRAGGKLWRREM